MEQNEIEYRVVKPEPSLADFVESFWMLAYHSEEEKEIIVLPDGRFDVFFSYSASEPFHVTLSGLGSEPSQSTLSPKSVIFAVSFKLLAIEYLLGTTMSSLLNKVDHLPIGFWNISMEDLTDFDVFCRKISIQLKELTSPDVDERKRRMFASIYASKGSLTVVQLSVASHWSSRQINRYFNHWFGISLKAYCNILRYRASFTQIREGNLFPEQNFTDQAHFIKTVKKYSGVTPKELTKNKNDRFIQFLTLPKK